MKYLKQCINSYDSLVFSLWLSHVALTLRYAPRIPLPACSVQLTLTLLCACQECNLFLACLLFFETSQIPAQFPIKVFPIIPCDVEALISYLFIPSWTNSIQVTHSSMVAKELWLLLAFLPLGSAKFLPTYQHLTMILQHFHWVWRPRQTANQLPSIQDASTFLGCHGLLSHGQETQASPTLLYSIACAY